MTGADAIPEAWIKAARTVTATGALIGTHTTSKHVDVTLRMPLDGDVRAEKEQP